MRKSHTIQDRHFGQPEMSILNRVRLPHDTHQVVLLKAKRLSIIIMLMLLVPQHGTQVMRVWRRETSCSQVEERHPVPQNSGTERHLDERPRATTSFRSFGFFELSTWADTGTCTVERPYFFSDHTRPPCTKDRGRTGSRVSSNVSHPTPPRMQPR